jgi:hypothetical protein
MHGRPPEQLAVDTESLLQEWESLRKDDPDAVREHLAKLRTVAVYLNARIVSPDIPHT